MSLHDVLSRTFLLCRDAEIVGENRPTDDELVEAFQGTRVLLVADEANLAAPAGQHALAALVNLVARLGVAIRLAIPDVPLLGYQPPLRGSRLRDALLDLGADVLPDYSIALDNATASTDLAFVLGDTPWSGQATLAIRLSGDSWSGMTSPIERGAARWSGDFPIGALVAAGVAAPEAFKFALRRLGAAMPYPLSNDYLVPVESAAVRVAPPDTATGPFPLGHVDFVSGGALTHATLFTLLHLPAISATVRVIEPERLDQSNLNRYALARRSDVDALKTAILANYQQTSLTITGLPIRYSAATRQDVLPFASQVVVGTDDIPTRWDVQREWPRWLGVGTTSHFLTITSSHQTGQPCAGCLHPRDDPDTRLIPTVSFVSYWAGLLLAVRLLRHHLGHLQDGIDQHIWCVPLRLDQARAYWPREIAYRGDCPVGCPRAKSISGMPHPG